MKTSLYFLKSEPWLLRAWSGTFPLQPQGHQGEQRRDTGALSWHSMDFLAWGSPVLGAPSRCWLQLHELGTSSGSDTPSAVPVPPIPAASTAAFPQGSSPGIGACHVSVAHHPHRSTNPGFCSSLSLHIYIYLFKFFSPPCPNGN